MAGQYAADVGIYRLMSVLRHSTGILLLGMLVFTAPVIAQKDGKQDTARATPSKSQEKDTAKANDEYAVVQGKVLDSAEKGLSGAEVLILDANNKVVAKTTSASNGSFAFKSISSGRYRFAARAIGFQQGRSDLMEISAPDTLDIHFVLDVNEGTLAEVNVTGRGNNAAYRITAAEIAKKPDRDALDVILNRRIRMLGDTYKGCMADTSTFTLDFRYIRKSPKSMSMDSSMPLRLFINGRWHGVRSIKDVLAEIPAEDIAEINYVDCWDKDRPRLRNSLLVVLKPGKRY